MAFCRLEDVHPVPNGWGVAWMLAAATALALFARAFNASPSTARRQAWASLGAFFLSFPAWRTFLGVLPNLVKTFCAQGDLAAVIPGGVTLPPAPGPLLSAQFIAAILDNLGPIALGALCLLQARSPGWWRRPAVAAMADGLRGRLPMGRGEAASVRLGVAAFPLLAAANVVLLLLTSDPRVRNSDDSAYFSAVGLYHALLIPLAASFAEELLYRGVMQQGLKRALLHRLPRGASIPLAIAVQSLLFAYAHAGYQNIQHLLFAFLFAAVAGLVVERWGIWCAIALHFLIDFYALGLSAAQAKGVGFVASDPMLAAGLVLVGIGVLWVAVQEIGRWKTRRGPAA